MLESPLKKVKLTEEEQLNSNCHTKSLFTQLPNELFLYITDFLIGNNHLKDNDFLLSFRYIKPSNSYDEDGKSDEYYQQYIPPFENIQTLLNLLYCNKHIFQSLTGGIVTNNSSSTKKENEELITREWNEVDNYWLERINFYEKYLYWMKTSSFDNLHLGTGDLTARQINEMCKTQTLVQRIERGLIVDEKDAIDKDSSWDNDEDDEENDENNEENEDDEEGEKKNKKKKTLDEKNSEEPKSYSQEQVNEDLFNRLKLLEFKKEDFISNEIFKSTSLFQYFLFRILMLSLKMFTNIETNADFSSGCGIDYTLLSEEKLEIYDDERQNLSEDEHLKGLVIVKDNSWKRFCSANPKKPATEEKTRSKRQSSKASVTDKKEEDLGPPLEKEELLKKLKKYGYIQFKGITDLNPFENLVFPDNIQYLTFSFNYDEFKEELRREYFANGKEYLRNERKERKKNSDEEDFLQKGKHKYGIEEDEEMGDNEEEEDVSEKKKEETPKKPFLFGEFSFPNVRYLNIAQDLSDFDPYFDIKVLETLLQKKRFPNLTHLTLSGFHIFDNLLSSDLLPQLQTLEIAESYKEEGRLVKFLNLLHKKRSELKHLKHFVVQLELDARWPTINRSQLEKYYNGLLENVCTSIGHSSTSRFYYACGE